MARGLALGNLDRIPLSMVLINYLALLLTAWIAAYLTYQHQVNGSAAHKLSFPSFAPLMIPLAPGLLMAFGRDLGEATAAAWLVLAALSLHHKRIVFFAIAISAAILTREAALLAAIAAWLLAARDMAISPRAQNRRTLLIFSIPLVVFALWQWKLYSMWGTFPFVQAPSNRGWPGIGFFHQLWASPYRTKPVESAVQALYLGWHLTLTTLVVRALKSERPLRLLFQKPVSPAVFNDQLLRPWLWLSWIIWSAFASCFSEIVWDDDWGFTRILSDWSILGMLLLLTSRLKPLRINSVFGYWTIILALGTGIRLIVKV